MDLCAFWPTLEFGLEVFPGFIVSQTAIPSTGSTGRERGWTMQREQQVPTELSDLLRPQRKGAI